MKRYLIIALVALALSLAAIVGTSAPSPHAATSHPTFDPAPFNPFSICAPSACGGGDGINCNNNYSTYDHLYRNYAGYQKNQVPPVGSSFSATIKYTPTGNHITSTGVASAAWTGIIGTAGEWIQAGLDYDGVNGLQRYVEWNTGGGTPADEHLTEVGSATLGTNYTVTINHVGSGLWKATVGGSSWIQSGTLPGSMTTIQTTTESQESNPTVSCNGVDAVFTSMNPARNTMSNLSTAPDFVENLGATTFEGVQIQTGS